MLLKELAVDGLLLTDMIGTWLETGRIDDVAEDGRAESGSICFRPVRTGCAFSSCLYKTKM